MDVAKILIEAGAQLSALNSQQQTPLDVAKLNREAAMVEFLTQYSASSTTAE